MLVRRARGIASAGAWFASAGMHPPVAISRPSDNITRRREIEKPAISVIFASCGR